MVFTEFLEMVEELFSADVVDDIIDAAELASDGAYTAVGTYPHSEMVALVTALSQETGIAIPDLLKTYGRHLFGRFATTHGQFLLGAESAFEFLAKLETYVHVEVKKLYPDAELPSFDIHRPDHNILEMTYHSERAMADFAEGLIEGCRKHFNEDFQIAREQIDEQATTVKFILSK